MYLLYGLSGRKSHKYTAEISRSSYMIYFNGGNIKFGIYFSYTYFNK